MRNFKGLIVLAAAIITLAVISVTGRPQEALAAPQANCIYVIQSGDQLRNIAARFHTSVGTLASINHLAHPDRIYPGQRITICHGFTAASQGIPIVQPPQSGGDAMTGDELAYVHRVFGQRGWDNEAMRIIACESGYRKNAWNHIPVYWHNVFLGHAGGIFQIVDATFQSTAAYRQGRSRYDAYAATDAAFEIVSRDNANGWRWREWACSAVL